MNPNDIVQEFPNLSTMGAHPSAIHLKFRYFGANIQASTQNDVVQEISNPSTMGVHLASLNFSYCGPKA